MKNEKMLKKFEDLDELASDILQLMSQFIDVNTLFIAKNDGETNEIRNVLNREEALLEEGDTTPYGESYCKISVDKGFETLLIPDITTDERSKSLGVTHQLGSGSFIGIPIYYKNGDNYGTICGLHTKPYQFSEENVEMFETMASLLTYVVELDRANKQINHLSAPLVPITEGVAILPITGKIQEERAEFIIQNAISNSQELALDYLVIDLSGISEMDQSVTSYLLKIVNILRLIGVTPIVTGIRPDLAMKAVEFQQELKDVSIRSNLESAMNEIGFQLKKE